jgi:crotonobetaine/carnitine-CoA ligase
MLPILYKQPPRADDASHPCRMVLSAACPKEIWTQFEDRFGVSIVEFYGTVEGGLTLAGPGCPPGSIGREVAGNEIRIVRDDGSNCESGEVGRLIARPTGQPASVRYYKDESASAAKVVGGWLHTGDRAYRDTDGFLWYVDRDDHFIRRRGENISSVEVEAAVEQHPNILECAAYALPSELAEDEVAVAVVPRSGCVLAPEDVVTHCQGRLADFQVPRYVRIVESLPKTETHRAQKILLRQDGVTEDTWDSQHGASPTVEADRLNDSSR